MTTTALRDSPAIRTSALGYMRHPSLDAVIEAVPIATTMPDPATANNYPQSPMTMWGTIAPSIECTATGPIGQTYLSFMSAESTAEAIMEIRRRSGLTWEELGELFDVSRRSVHHWANGKPAAAGHERTVHKMLAAIRHLDQDNQAGTRALLLTIDPSKRASTFELLKDGRFDEAISRIEGSHGVQPHRVPLSRAAGDARRPPAPAHLLGAVQDRPHIPAKARAVSAVQVTLTNRQPKAAG